MAVGLGVFMTLIGAVGLAVVLALGSVRYPGMEEGSVAFAILIVGCVLVRRGAREYRSARAIQAASAGSGDYSDQRT